MTLLFNNNLRFSISYIIICIFVSEVPIKMMPAQRKCFIIVGVYGKEFGLLIGWHGIGVLTAR